MKNALLFVIYFITIVNLSGKSFPGYIIDSQGDTVHGYIFIGTEQGIYKNIGFSSSKTKRPTITYQPSDILAFQFLDTRFISAKIPVEEKFEPLTSGEFIQPKSHIQHVFLAVDFKGKVSLYFFQDESNRKHYYVKMDKSDFQELTKYEYIVKKKQPMLNQTLRDKVTVNKYQNILIRLFRDCDQIEKEIKRAFLLRGDLIHLFEKYHQCIGQQETAYYRNPYGKENPLHWSLQLGMNFTDFMFEANANPWETYYLTNISLPKKPTPTFGANVDFYSSNHQPKWFISSGLWYKFYSIKAEYNDGTEISLANGNYDQYSYNTKVHQLTIPLSFGHIIKMGPALGTISIGVSGSYSKLSNNNLLKQQFLNDRPIFSRQELLLFRKFSNIEYSALAAFGISYNKWGIKSYALYNNGLLGKSGLVSLRSYSLILAMTYQIF